MKASILPNPKVMQITRLISATFVLMVVLLSIFVIFDARAAIAAGNPVTLSLSVQKEQRKAAADGTTSVTLVPAEHAAPGDRLIYVLTYVNTGKAPVSGMVVDYPLPQGVTYRAAADGSQAPQLSSDGSHFAVATASPVAALRWQIPGEIAPGAQGRVSFKATLN